MRTHRDDGALPHGASHDILDEMGLIRLFGPMTDASVRPIIDAILSHNLARDRECLRLWVNSPGGDIDQGFALLDLMHWSGIPIHTTGLGLVASMGLLVLMAGAPGHRTVMPRTTLMSHCFSARTVGNHAELIAARAQHDLYHRRIIEHYRSCTGVAAQEQIESTLLRSTDRWLSPEEAVSFGIVDRVWSPSAQ